MPCVATWPSLETERRDRNTVLTALTTLGRHRLRFSADEVRAEIIDNLHAELHHGHQLARHIRALVPVTVIAVQQPLTAFVHASDTAPADHEGTSAPSGPGHRSRHLYALTEREAELATTAPELTAPARVYVALWVAVRAFGVDAVPTTVVTQVCRAIPALSVDLGQQMTMRLKNLSDRTCPLTQTEVAYAGDGTQQRWTRWRPIGRAPEDPMFEAAVPEFDGWVELVRAIKADAADLGEYATAHDLAVDLITLAISTTQSPLWRQGHPVTMETIRAVCAERADARELVGRLRRMGTSIGTVLGDASKRQIAGRARAKQRIIKAGTVNGEQPCYDVPALTGFVERGAYVPYQNIHEAMRHERLEALAAEDRSAAGLARSPAIPQVSAVLGAIAAFRVHGVAAAVAGISQQIDDVLSRAHLLSSIAQGQLNRKGTALQNLQARLGLDVDETARVARSALSAVGLELDALLAARGPVLIGDDYKEWVPAAGRRGKTGPQLMAQATAVPRLLNPEFVARKSSNPRQAASTGLDRVAGLVHLAERQNARTLSFLQLGARVLGSMLREPTLAAQLVATDDPRWWGTGLAALALLGDPRAEETANAVLSDSQAPSDRLVHSLYALAVVRSQNITMPEWLLDRHEPMVMHAIRGIIEARRTGGWLLPG